MTSRPVDIGGRIKLNLSRKEGSLSVLVPGEDDLLRRHCQGIYNQELRIWFKVVEYRAWKWVKAVYDTQPSSIFLVTGQTLTTEYAISHITEATSACEVVVEANVGIPNIIDSRCLVGYAFNRATISAGFDVVKKKKDEEDSDSELYSVFLEVVQSRPVRRLAVRQADATKLLETMK